MLPSSLPSPDIRSAPNARYPAGPRLLPRLLSGKLLRQTPIDFLTEAAREFGDLVHFRGLEGHVFLFNHPALIQELMVDNERRNRRASVMQRARAVLGDGLLTSEEPLHMRQRRLAAPAFHRERIAGYGEIIAGYAAAMVERWQPGPLDLHPEMLLLALRIVGKCLFDLNTEAESRRIAAAVDSFMVPPPPAWLPFQEQLQKLPFGPPLRIRRGIEDLDRILYGMIAERRRSPGDRGDLLSMLLSSVDNEGGGVAGGSAAAPAACPAHHSGSSAVESLEKSNRGSGRNDTYRMSDKQVRDECLTVMLAGHETTADALSFALWLLAKHPQAQDELHDEAVRVLGDRPPAAADYPALRYSYMVFAESMRLYPPVWVLGRAAGPEPYQFRGFTIPPGSNLLAPQIVVHRDPRFWPEPDRFQPRRFDPEYGNAPGSASGGDIHNSSSNSNSGSEARTTRHKFSYFPFGGGSRQCIGESLAWMEGIFVLSTICRAWRLRPAPGSPSELPITPAINLRPTHGIPLTLERR